MVIDFHAHPFMIQELYTEDSRLEFAVKEVFGLLFPPQPFSVFMKEMDAAGVDYCVLLPIDCTTAHGCRVVKNEAVAALCADNPRLIGFASVDPNTEDAVAEMREAVKTLGLRGLKLDPALQQFDACSETVAYPIYHEAAALDIPVIIHCGLNWAPPAMLGNGNPLMFEKAFYDNPGTKFIIPHLGWPWCNEACALAMKYPNVFLDTSVVYSGTPAECLDHVINGTIGRMVFERNLADKVVFGSDYPRADMRRTIRGINSIGFSDYFSEKLFYKNGSKLLGGV